MPAVRSYPATSVGHWLNPEPCNSWQVGDAEMRRCKRLPPPSGAVQLPDAALGSVPSGQRPPPRAPHHSRQGQDDRSRRPGAGHHDGVGAGKHQGGRPGTQALARQSAAPSRLSSKQAPNPPSRSPLRASARPRAGQIGEIPPPDAPNKRKNAEDERSSPCSTTFPLGQPPKFHRNSPKHQRKSPQRNSLRKACTWFLHILAYCWRRARG